MSLTIHLQYYGFKPGLSTNMCTGTLKNVVSRYINYWGSSVLECFLDASEPFEVVNHRLLFDKLLDNPGFTTACYKIVVIVVS